MRYVLVSLLLLALTGCQNGGTWAAPAYPTNLYVRTVPTTLYEHPAYAPAWQYQTPRTCTTMQLGNTSRESCY